MLEEAMLRIVVEFINPISIFDPGAALLAWRTLSRESRKVADGTATRGNAGRLVLTAGLSSLSAPFFQACNKLDFICKLGARVEGSHHQGSGKIDPRGGGQSARS